MNHEKSYFAYIKLQIKLTRLDLFYLSWNQLWDQF